MKKITLLNELSYTFGDSLKYFDIYLHNLSNKEYKIVFPIKEGSPTSVYSDDVIVVPGSFRYFKGNNHKRHNYNECRRSILLT